MKIPNKHTVYRIVLQLLLCDFSVKYHKSSGASDQLLLRRKLKLSHNPLSPPLSPTNSFSLSFQHAFLFYLNFDKFLQINFVSLLMDEGNKNLRGREELVEILTLQTFLKYKLSSTEHSALTYQRSQEGCLNMLLSIIIDS